jgi:hypothetical protein
VLSASEAASYGTIDPVTMLLGDLLLWQAAGVGAWSRASTGKTRDGLPCDPISHDAVAWSPIGALTRAVHDRGFRLRTYEWPIIDRDLVMWTAKALASGVSESRVETYVDQYSRGLSWDELRRWIAGARDARISHVRLVLEEREVVRARIEAERVSG